MTDIVKTITQYTNIEKSSEVIKELLDAIKYGCTTNSSKHELITKLSNIIPTAQTYVFPISEIITNAKPNLKISKTRVIKIKSPIQPNLNTIIVDVMIDDKSDVLHTYVSNAGILLELSNDNFEKELAKNFPQKSMKYVVIFSGVTHLKSNSSTIVYKNAHDVLKQLKWMYGISLNSATTPGDVYFKLKQIFKTNERIIDFLKLV